MCGITGVIAFTEEGKKNLHKVSDSTYSLIKRGPDGEGLFFHNNVALGHRRLSIIDTSNLAAQPFTDTTRQYTIVFNGEIFNFKELRKSLETKGYIFKSQSDTEVLLNLFIQEKEKCLEKLDGEFAFAIYDNKAENIFIARDRYGIKPIYYYFDDNFFAFASEMKALLKYDIPKKIDIDSLHTYLHLNYIPSPYSIIENVQKIEKGSYVYIEKSKNLIKGNYYSIPYSSEINTSLNYPESQKELKKLLHNSVKNRMIADVPLGAFLSGGIDSSIITAIAAQETCLSGRQAKHLNTFSIGYKNEPLFDETHYAQLVAKKYNTNHTVFELSNYDLYASLFDVLDYIDEPFADSSALAVNILSMHTKKHVTVALSGDGADELFAGYNKHAGELKARYKSVANTFIKSSAGIIDKLPKSRNSKLGNRIRQLDKFSKGLKLDEKERYWRWAGFTSENEVNGLVKSKTHNYKKRKSELLNELNKDYNSVLLMDMKLVLESDMLVKVDRMSMSRSLEVRVPFLDNKVVDFAFSLPPHFKIDDKQRKKILKDTFRDMLPAELYNRGKQGFEVPLLNWFKTDLKSLITDDLLSDKFIEEQNIFNVGEIKKLKQQLFSSNPNDAVARVWALIVFQYWYRKYFI